ncbi:DUF2917 domain-containing protein [Roseateles sp. P5_E7]
MTLAASLPRFFMQLGRQPQPARAARTDTAALPQQRTMALNAIVTLENRPLQLHVLRGCVWITRDGCSADRVLKAGDSFEQRPGAPVLVQALENTELLIADAVAHAQDA